MEEIVRLQDLQFEILSNYEKIVKPGGMMVYATCSLLPSENQMQVQKFLGLHPGVWTLVEEIHVFPHKQGYDGFYGALLRRRE